MEKPETKPCNLCGVRFDPRNSGVAGQLNGKPVYFCPDCCRKDY